VNVAQKIGPRNGMRREAHFMKMILLILFGPGALNGESFTIEWLICWFVIGLNSHMGGLYV
jgi:hypothetical protein